MKRYLTSLVLFTLAVALHAQDRPNYFRQYANEPVPITNRTGGANNKLYLVGEDRGELVFRYQPNDRQEIAIPLDTEDLLIVFTPPKEYLDHVDMIEAGSYEKAIRGMRPYAYPLIKYLQVPPTNINIHPIVDRFVFAQARGGDLDEAVELVRRLPLTKLGPTYVDYAFVVTERLVEAGRNADALAMLNRIPLNSETTTLLPKVMAFANTLREEGNVTEALFLYQRIQDIPDTDVQEEAIIWTAYCNMETGRSETAELFLDKAGDLKPTQRAYSLMKLVQGRLAEEAGSTIDAMSDIAQGVVAADIGYPWMPELLYRSGSLYEKLSQPEVASEIYGEVDLFFASTPWGEKSRERLAQLNATN